MSESDKLYELLLAYGYERDEEEKFLEEECRDGIVPAICVNPGCDYSVDLEPDQDAGFCEACGTNTVKSALILAGLI